LDLAHVGLESVDRYQVDPVEYNPASARAPCGAGFGHVFAGFVGGIGLLKSDEHYGLYIEPVA
jgi:hypothetical protein